MNGYLRPLWFILIVILLALLFSYHPQSAQAQSQIQSDWPTGVKIDQNCYTANIYNNLQLKAMARHDGFVYYLKEVKNAYRVVILGTGVIKGKIVYVWEREDNKEIIRVPVEWAVTRSPDCTDCKNKAVSSNTSPWSKYSYSANGHTRTQSRSIPLFDADNPSWGCGSLLETETDLATQYCTNLGTGETQWFFPLQTVPSYAEPGDCTEPNLVASPQAPAPEPVIQYVYIEPPAPTPPTFMDWVNTWWPIK